MDNGYRLIVLNTNTNLVGEIIAGSDDINPLLTVPFDVKQAHGFDRNPVDGKVYLANLRENNLLNLYEIDLLNKGVRHSKSFACSFSKHDATSMGFTANGDLYVYQEVSAFRTGNLHLIDWETGDISKLGSSGTPSILGGDFDTSRNVFWATDEWFGKLYQLDPSNGNRTWTSESTWNYGSGPNIADVDVTPGGEVLVACHDRGDAKIMIVDVLTKTFDVLHTVNEDAELRIVSIPKSPQNHIMIGGVNFYIPLHLGYSVTHENYYSTESISKISENKNFGNSGYSDYNASDDSETPENFLQDIYLRGIHDGRNHVIESPEEYSLLHKKSHNQALHDLGLDANNKISDAWQNGYKQGQFAILNNPSGFSLITEANMSESMELFQEAHELSLKDTYIKAFEQGIKEGQVRILENPSGFSLITEANMSKSMGLFQEAHELSLEDVRKKAFEQGIKEGQVRILENPSDFSLITEANMSESMELLQEAYELSLEGVRKKAFEHGFKEGEKKTLTNNDQNISKIIYPNGWFFTEKMGWLWTNNETYPWFYSAENSDWIYFKDRRYYSRLKESWEKAH